MKAPPRISSWPAVLGACCLAWGCGAEPPPPATPASSAREGFSLAAQSVGQPADGLTLRSIRHAPHPTYYRVVFDLGLQEGQVATTVPSAEASYRDTDRSIELTIHGVRHDLTGNRPLRKENGEPWGTPVPVDKPPVTHLARVLVLDDAAVAYRIQLSRKARFRLLGLTDPARIVVDVENTGGASPR